MRRSPAHRTGARRRPDRVVHPPSRRPPLLHSSPQVVHRVCTTGLGTACRHSCRRARPALAVRVDRGRRAAYRRGDGASGSSRAPPARGRRAARHPAGGFVPRRTLGGGRAGPPDGGHRRLRGRQVGARRASGALHARGGGDRRAGVACGARGRGLPRAESDQALDRKASAGVWAHVRRRGVRGPSPLLLFGFLSPAGPDRLGPCGQERHQIVVSPG